MGLWGGGTRGRDVLGGLRQHPQEPPTAPRMRPPETTPKGLEVRGTQGSPRHRRPLRRSPNPQVHEVETGVDFTGVEEGHRGFGGWSDGRGGGTVGGG